MTTKHKNKTPAVVQLKPKSLAFRVPKSAMDRWVRSLPVMEASAEVAQLDILGPIGADVWSDEGVTAAGVRAALAEFGGADVTVTINSPGGDAFEGIAIYNLLREYGGAVDVRVIGVAASAASVIAMAGDRIEMGEAAMMMIHSAWGLVAGNQEDLRQFADFLDSLDRSVASVYAARAGMKADDVLEMMRKETWMTADEAVDSGFADASFSDGSKKDDKKKKMAASGAVFARSMYLSARAPGGKPRAASGAPRIPATTSGAAPGVTGPVASIQLSSKGTTVKMTIAEQIASFEAKRTANTARMEAIMAVAAEAGRTLEADETAEYDTLAGEVNSVDTHLRRLREHENLIKANAARVPATVGADPASAANARGPSGIISVRPNVEPGVAFARYVKALAMARGNVMHALEIAKASQAWQDTTPQVQKALMAAVVAGDTTTAGWASELVYNENLVDQFIELLRPMTILGRLPNLTRVPFNVRMSGQDSGSTAYWVGQGKPVPVSKLNTLEVTLGIAKAAGLVVLTEELVRSSAPSAEVLVRNDLLKAIATFLDVQFVDPNVAAVANVSPASITNGVTAVTPTGTNAAALRADVQTLFNTFIQNNDNVDPSSMVWIMETTQALAISLMQNALGQKEFPGITMKGGEFFGLPVVTSMSANIPGSPNSGKMIILANQADILIADDGGLTVDASKEAAIQMLDNPTNDTTTPTATTMVSMFQTNSVAIKAVRYANWKKRRSTAVQYIKEAQYTS